MNNKISIWDFQTCQAYQNNLRYKLGPFQALDLLELWFLLLLVVHPKEILHWPMTRLKKFFQHFCEMTIDKQNLDNFKIDLPVANKKNSDLLATSETHFDTKNQRYCFIGLFQSLFTKIDIFWQRSQKIASNISKNRQIWFRFTTFRFTTFLMIFFREMRNIMILFWFLVFSRLHEIFRGWKTFQDLHHVNS